MAQHVLVYVEAVDVAAEGAVWYARRIGGGTFRALHVPGKNTDTGISARWFDLTGGEPRLDVRPARHRRERVPSSTRSRALRGDAGRHRHRRAARAVQEALADGRRPAGAVPAQAPPARRAERRRRRRAHGDLRATARGQGARAAARAGARRPRSTMRAAARSSTRAASARTTCAPCTSASATGRRARTRSARRRRAAAEARLGEAVLDVRPPADGRSDDGGQRHPPGTAPREPAHASAAAGRSPSSAACSSSRT